MIELCCLFQMHHPIQMKPADSEKNNGKKSTIIASNFFFSIKIMYDQGA